MIFFSLRILYNKTNKNCVISVFFGSLLVGEAHSVARMGFKRPEVQILSPRPPRRSKVRFVPTSFLLLADASAAKKPPSPRSLAPPFPQKAPLGSPVRLQALSQRLAVATNLLRLPRLAVREMGRGVHAAPKKRAAGRDNVACARLKNRRAGTGPVRLLRLFLLFYSLPVSPTCSIDIN